MAPEPFSPRNPDFEAVVSESFARQTHMSSLGATLALVRAGEVHVALPHSAAHAQQHGFLHAGAIASIADSACGYAALTVAPAGHEVLAVEFKINLLRPANAERYLACARVLRPGRTLTVSLAEVFGLTGAERELIATMLSTVIVRGAPTQ